MTGKLILTFIAMGIGVMVIAVDIAAVTVALPSVEKDFQTTIGTVEWVVNGYVLAWAVFMVTCGRLADMFGRKKIFFAGIVVFGAASLAGALAYNSNMLISARVVQGAGAALLWPAILGIVYSSVSEKQKGLAVGLILGAAGVGNAAGPLLGGFLTEFFSWRAVLYFNIPFALIAAVITYFVVKEKGTGESGGKIDYIGILTVSLSLVSLLYAVNQSPSWGWISGKTLALLAVFAGFLVVFILYERRTTDALIPEDVMNNRRFMITGALMPLAVPAFFSILLFIPQYLEKFYGYRPLDSGAALVPMLLTFALTAPVSGTIYNRLGPRLSIFTGMVLLCVGTVLILLFGFSGSYVGMVPGLVLFGVGVGFSIPSITTAAVGAVDEARTSLAGGIIYMFELAGGALGLSIITTIFTDAVRKDIAVRLTELGFTLTGAQKSDLLDFILGSGSRERLVSELGPDKLNTVFSHVRESFVTGLQEGLGFAAVILALGAVFTLIFIEGKKRSNA